MSVSTRSRRAELIISPSLVNIDFTIPPIPIRSPLRPISISKSVSGGSTVEVPTPVQTRRIDDEELLLVDSPVEEEVETVPTKRQHALLELLSSERAYASDLSLITQVHLPLALGQPISLPDSSSPCTTPMSAEDARIIFSNIAELAVFSDHFCGLLEQAVGDVVRGGQGDDRVGALFMEIIPDMEKPYKYYINKHPSALAHLQSLPSTPALSEYLNHTQSVASCHSHAWDLSSLLIKPVQRLLKYSLLLAAIIDETPEGHEDKENLKQARIRMEQLAHDVNEGRRRAEVVKEVLTAKKKHSQAVNLTRMKSLRHGRSSTGSEKLNGEAAAVEKMALELKQIEAFVPCFSKSITDWSKSMSDVIDHLRSWALSFRRVLGLSCTQPSEAFDAFLAVVESQLLPLSQLLDSELDSKVLAPLSRLVSSMSQPNKLLKSMQDVQNVHYHLLNMTVSQKNRPSPSLLSASTKYVALRGQLAAELPVYLGLLHRGLAGCTRMLARVQAEFWGTVRDQWADLWERLRVEGEMNAGSEETMKVWETRWTEVDKYLSSLGMMKPVRRGREGDHVNNTRPRSASSGKERVTPLPTNERTSSMSSSKTLIDESRSSPSGSSSTCFEDDYHSKSHLRDSWLTKPSKYTCHVINACQLITNHSVSYYNFPFFSLRLGDLLEVLQEAGHPSLHPGLPVYVDEEGEDCLLLCRNEEGAVGWALASFLEPLDMR